MICIDHVSKRIRGAEVLQDIDLKLQPGVVAGFSGINGSGKTMLMRCIAGLVKPSSGSISIDGKRLWKDISFPPSIGALIEGPAFVDTYSGLDNLDLIASIKRRVGREEAAEQMRRVGLSPEDRKKYRKYSLGMKQRLGIAAALMEHPAVVLLDEPTNALDAKGIELLKGLVREEKRRGATVALTCHDQDILRELADVVYFMESGRVTGFENAKGGGPDA